LGRVERLASNLSGPEAITYNGVFSEYPASTICLIASGGVLYSVGVIFHLWDRLRFQNAIWHAFVSALPCSNFAQYSIH